MPSKFGDWCLPTGLKKEFFSGPQNTETALVPYMLSSVFWIQGRNILDWRRRICRLQSKELENFLTIEWILPPGLELEGFPELGNPLTVEITLPRAPIRERMPLLHIGRLPCNEAQRESPWAPMCWRILPAAVRILPRDKLPCQCPQKQRQSYPEGPKGRTAESPPRIA